eukprot:351342-Chlamydomonas_euryale.AAC.9
MPKPPSAPPPDFSSLQKLKPVHTQVALNLLAGRRPGDRTFHVLMPWVLDFSTPPHQLVPALPEATHFAHHGAHSAEGALADPPADTCAGGGAAASVGTAAVAGASAASVCRDVTGEAAPKQLPPSSRNGGGSGGGGGSDGGSGGAFFPSSAAQRGWRSLRVTRYREFKGDAMLDATAAAADVPHHVSSEPLSELTYCIYLARVLPKQVWGMPGFGSKNQVKRAL